MRTEDPALQMYMSAPQTDSDGSDDVYEIVGYESAQPAWAQMALPFDADRVCD